MKIIALLPMKAHSERIPNKNMKDFYGKPFYRKIMESLLKSKYIESIVIDTDSTIIAEDALKYFNRVKIIKRPEKLRGDFVPMNDIVAYDLSQLKGEHFLQTHSTNPPLTTEATEAIDKVIKLCFNSIK